ncbi:PhzF family phenazine biosynthesis protein [Lacisediminimonas profundi]|uniref:PhzF family phenazine biosynthesis protein n=1 Tax=Lacisediminimonas profundi TaxID=2603856 RepID=UPI00124B15A3|nr:PhzF family phenazine biosynthesis protein [Lacisediminimonas profundi]
MTRNYKFRIMNVFAESTFGGNALCVFEDATGLGDDEMQSLARQFNLSETTFILPSAAATARVRIFTPGNELPFAGHPTLGTAHVLRELRGTGDTLSIEFKAGIVPVSAIGNQWTFVAPASAQPDIGQPGASPGLIARLVGLEQQDLASDPLWVNTGVDQLLIPVKTVDAVRRAAPDAALLDQWPASIIGRKTAYLFAFDTPTTVLARYFFAMQNGGVGEDPGTGSACANLGGWLLHTGHSLPARIQVSQGEAVLRPCRLALDVTTDRKICVGGQVRQIAIGTVSI